VKSQKQKRLMGGPKSPWDERKDKGGLQAIGDREGWRVPEWTVILISGSPTNSCFFLSDFCRFIKRSPGGTERGGGHTGQGKQALR